MSEAITTALDKEELRELVAEALDVETREVTDHARFLDELDVDSLMALEITVRIEKQYGVKMSDDEISEMSSLQDTYDLLVRKAGVLT